MSVFHMVSCTVSGRIPYTVSHFVVLFAFSLRNSFMISTFFSVLHVEERTAIKVYCLTNLCEKGFTRGKEFVTIKKSRKKTGEPGRGRQKSEKRGDRLWQIQS